MNLKKIKRAIISVYDKSDLKILLPALKKFDVEILSSGGSFDIIKRLGYKCTKISNFTGFKEILDGRLKTLHPKIYAGILSIRDNKKHKDDISKLNFSEIDLVIVNFYPFDLVSNKFNNKKKIIEYIDIGGPTLVRAAAKNFNDVTVITDKLDYLELSQQLKKLKGSTSIKFRKHMAAKAFGLTAYYDSIISEKFNSDLNIKFPKKITFHGRLKEHLRYGENPHQQGSLYIKDDELVLDKLHGKNLSYNNYNDIYSAITILNSFKNNSATVIIKHANPCGVSNEKNQVKSFKNALMCDPLSAFGGIVAVNSVITKKLAIELNKVFFEVIICKNFNKDALKILKKRKNIRLIKFNKLNLNNNKNYLFFENSFLAQDADNILFNEKNLKIVTRKKPTLNQLNSMKFAFNVCKFVKSNAIVLVNDKSTIGIGAGQPSRFDSCKLATNKALKFVPKKIANSIAASDAFFPFEDGVQELIKNGIKVIIQPGGSINDSKIIKLANKFGIVMAFTDTRHFKH